MTKQKFSLSDANKCQGGKGDRIWSQNTGGAFVDTVFRVGPSEEGMVEQRLSEGKQEGHLVQEHSRLRN